MKTVAGTLLILAALACKSEAEQSTRSAAISTETSAAAARTPAATPAIDELDRLDRRAPVPLLAMMANHQKQNMREHLVAVQEIVAAAAASDFSAVESAARRIGYSEQMGRMCNHMGAAAPGFSERALAFHHTADTIASAARQRDLPGVLRALGETLSSCTSCHAAFKQQVVAVLPEK